MSFSSTVASKISIWILPKPQLSLTLMRNFVQDDGHIFCSSAQIQSEVSAFIDLTFRVYKHFYVLLYSRYF
jgi:threonyl-tRNA synthetase